MDFAKLALTGLISGLSLTACDNKTTTTPAPEVAQPVAPEAPAAEAPAAEAQYTDVHDCAGKNSCKGLGGCKVSAEKLASLAAAVGVDAAAAGEPHACKGLNACKGLGGCHVSDATFAELKAKAEGGEAPAPAEGEGDEHEGHEGHDDEGHGG
jgi:hypothetical protein